MNYVVILDFSFLWHVCRHAALNAGPKYNLDDAIIHHAEGKLRTFRKAFEKLRVNDYDIIFAEDRHATRKLRLYPDYRKGRVNNADAKNRLKSHFVANGYANRFCYSPGNEADDVIATLVGLSKSQNGLFSIVVTGDRDLWQLIGPTTAVFNPIKKALVTLEDVTNAFAVGPTHVALVKALWGDSGDCVPNACPRTQKQLLTFVRQAETGHLEDFKRLICANWSSLSARCQQIVTAGAAQVDLNWQLVRLDEACPLKWD